MIFSIKPQTYFYNARFIILSSLLGFCLSISQVNASAVKEYRLDNGLKLLVKEDHRFPVVVSQIWYRIGSAYEPGGQTGISHVLEHMMFKGTEKFPNDSFNQIIAQNGGEDNAFTSKDYTAYFQKLSADRLEVSFELEADRMRNLIFSNEDFNKEVMVVQEERRWRTDDKPRSRAYEQLFVSAYENSGYHHPVIGWMNDLKSLQPYQVKNWYQQFYHPNNATLVVVGDVHANEVYALAKKYFKINPPIPKKLNSVNTAPERKQLGMRSVKLELLAKVPYLTFAYKVPSMATAQLEWEPYALILLSGILDGGDSTRLPLKLIKQQQLAASVSCSYSPMQRLQSLFTFDAIPANGKTILEVEKALYEQIEKIKKDIVSKEELERIKNQIIASSVFEKDSIFYQAMKMGIAESIGIGWKKEADFVKNIRHITAEQIKQVANKYLIDKQLTRVEVVIASK